MKKQTYLIMLALVAFFASFVLNSCTPNPAEEPDSNDIEYEWREVILPGLFTINDDGKQIRFSQGNLQYTQSTDTWSFANQQYETLGKKNLTNAKLQLNTDEYDREYLSCSGDGLADKIDLFGFSGNKGTAKWGISISEDWSDYSGDFVDWGQNPIKNGGNKANQWRVLTATEWAYILHGRPNNRELIGIAQVNGVNGLILLPDNWVLPAGLSFKSGFAGEDGVYKEYQSYTSKEWEQMELAGAVFFPTTGWRFGTDITALDQIGLYWAYDYELQQRWEEEGIVDILFFWPVEFDGGGGIGQYIYVGLSVRLVQDVQ